MTRLLLTALAAWHGANALAMILAPRTWFATVPGVVDTGPYNGHFVADVGFGFLGSAAGLALAAARPGLILPAVLAPGIFLGGHALLHLADMALHGNWLRDGLAIVLPGLAPLALLAAAYRKVAA